MARNKQPHLNDIAEPAQVRMLSVYSGATHLGFLLMRGRSGIEALTADNKSLGFFLDQRSAADAISKAVSS